jgi:UDPglucose 6-dehydrogenase
MKIIIKGNGIVGKSTKKFLDFIGIAGHDIEFCDPPKNIVVKDYDKVDYVVICVPTPLDKDTGINDGSEILNAVADAESKGFKGCYVLRSTIGLTFLTSMNKRFKDRLLVWPEFIRANEWEYDSVHPNFILLAGKKAKKFSSDWFVVRPIFIMLDNPLEAMAMKLATNSFLASKVIFANQLQKLASKHNLNYKNICDCLQAEGRLGNTHWDVPGPDGYYGFGGMCFPKDIETYKTELQMAEINSSNIEATIAMNQEMRDVQNVKR